MRSVKTVQFRYSSSESIASLFEQFRCMCNDALRIALKEKPKNRFKLSELVYPSLKEYGLHTHYILSAIEVAFGIYKNETRKSDGYIGKAFLKLDRQSYRLNHLDLRIPTTPWNYIHLTLQGADYQLALIDDPALKKGEITITDRTIGVAVSREAVEIEPLGNVGVDVNLRNITISSTDGASTTFDTSGVSDVKERYNAARVKINQVMRLDRRAGRKLHAKYGKREKNRTVQALHIVSKAIVQEASSKGFGIIMEDLKGIRKLYRKGNGQGTSFRGMMNSWTFHEIQRQIEYKAGWLGIPVVYASPRGTSSKCPECDSSLIEPEERKVMCPSCNRTEDRDVLASRNIMMAAPLVRAARLPRRSKDSEPQKQENVSNPMSRWVEVDKTGPASIPI